MTMHVGQYVEVSVTTQYRTRKWMAGTVTGANVVDGRLRVLVEVTDRLRMALWADSDRLRLPAEHHAQEAA